MANIFQYLKGAIQRPKRTHDSGVKLKFQYLKGAIQRDLQLLARLAEAEFQYLKGAIQSPHRAGAQGAPASFQYLKGAIQSRQPCCRWRTTAVHFNTSKVRFRVVRGEDGLSPYEISIPQRCDSETGGSAGRGLAGCISIPQRCDSERPRRRRQPRGEEISIPQRCDSELATPVVQVGVVEDFNTSKVRFRVVKEGVHLLFPVAFQYLKGAIQSPCDSGPKPNVQLAKAVCNRPRASVLSSPYGSAQTPGD